MAVNCRTRHGIGERMSGLVFNRWSLVERRLEPGWPRAVRVRHVADARRFVVRAGRVARRRAPCELKPVP